jgi:hypothetical protein
MVDHDAELKKHFAAVKIVAESAKNTIEATISYWNTVYRVSVPNAENQVIPAYLMEELSRCAQELTGLIAILAPQT